MQACYDDHKCSQPTTLYFRFENTQYRCMFKIQLLNSNALTKHLYKNNVNISTVLNRSFKRSTFLRRKMQKHNHIRMAEIYPRVCN